jgi:diaminohydroxyphosphoribosylaminopyrimidine deaminase/5-amino-6-(5-phosphoribosylamino)uracil reductase
MTSPVDAAGMPWMRRALDLAERGRGFVEPNPLVGAVLVKNGQVVSEGWHEKYGQSHAEVNALARAQGAARGATCYVTLEPCCHVGKTPPCTDALIRAGVARVIAALADPFPQVAGQGANLLRAAGIPCEFGLCEQEARRQNAPYLMLLTAGRPYVHAKWAMTLDGKIATRAGDSKWISSAASRHRVHELRGRMDAIVIGIGTALADDPLLTARPSGPRTAMRVVLDSQARLPTASQLVQTAGPIPTLLVTSPSVAEAKLTPLRDAGCQVLRLGPDAEGRPNLHHLLAHLGQQRATNLLVEGGAQVLGSFLDAAAIDEVHAFIAPRLIGGTGAKTAMAGSGRDRIADALALMETTVESIDNDIYVHGYRREPSFSSQACAGRANEGSRMSRVIPPWR